MYVHILLITYPSEKSSKKVAVQGKNREMKWIFILAYVIVNIILKLNQVVASH